MEVAKSRIYLTGTEEEEITSKPISSVDNSEDTTGNATTLVEGSPKAAATLPSNNSVPSVPSEEQLNNNICTNSASIPLPESTPPSSTDTSVSINNNNSTEKKQELTSGTFKAKKDGDKDDRRRRRSSSPGGRNRSRSRSRSRDSSVRSRPNRGGRPQRSKYDDRRRRNSPKRHRRSRTRSRSPRRSRSPPNRHSRSSSSPRNTSPKFKSGRNRSPIVMSSRGKSPSSPSNVAKSQTPSLGLEMNKLDASSGNISSTMKSVVNVPQRFGKQQRCRDYDEKGYCMRGDQCPYDHGSDPVVLEGIGGVIDFPPTSRVNASNTPYAPTSAPSSNNPIPRHPLHPSTRSQTTHFAEYTPSDPSIWSNYYPNTGANNNRPTREVITRYAPPFPATNHVDLGRELINVPVNNNNNNAVITKGGMRTSVTHRLGPNVAQRQYQSNFKQQGQGKTLELRKIPPELNTISMLNDHFCKFGNIVNIQVHHENDPEAATITFSSQHEALAAYRSTEAVLNNRFIRVFWHSVNKNKIENRREQNFQNTEWIARKTHKNISNDENIPNLRDKVVLTKGNLVKTVYNTDIIENNKLKESVKNSTESNDIIKVNVPSTLTSPTPTTISVPDSTQSNVIDPKKQQIEAILKQRELLAAELAAKNLVEKQKKEAVKLKSEVERRQKQLLDKQMQQMKILMKKLDTSKDTLTFAEKKSLLETIKSLQNAMEDTRSQLPSINAAKQKVNQVIDASINFYFC